ncbi:MAG: M20 family metallopeptidase [Bacillota bacterium]
MSRVLEVLKDLVSLESVNVNLPGAVQGEREVIRYVDDFCRRLGLEPVDGGSLPDGRRNAVWRLNVPGATQTLMFEAHMDTVTLANMPDGAKPRVADGRLYGRGACDTKGSLAGMLCAVEELVRAPQGLSANILIGGMLEEETGLVGAGLAMEAGLRPDGIVVGEPTMLAPVIAHKGVARFWIKTRGRSAHTSQPQHGESAILQMLAVVRHLEEQVAPAFARRHHPLVGSPVQTVAMIEGGFQFNFVPEACRIAIDRRTLPTEDPAAVLEEYRQALADLSAAQPGIQAEIDQVVSLVWGLDSPPEAPVVQAALAAVQGVMGRPATPVGAPYGTNGSKYWGIARIPCVVLGPGDIAQAHTENEWIALEQLEASVPVYTALARQFGKKG